MPELTMWILYFVGGLCLSLGIFVFNLVRTNGVRTLPTLARIAGRSIVITCAMLSAYFGFAVLVGAVIIVPVYFLGGLANNLLGDLGGISALLGICFLAVFIPVSAFNFGRDAARFAMYIQSSISVNTSALILGIFVAGLWLTLDTSDKSGNVLGAYAVVTLFIAMELWFGRVSGSGRVNALERWTLFALFCISLYLVLVGSFSGLAGIILAGYAAGSVLLRWMTLFLPQHASYTSGMSTTRQAWPEIQKRFALFAVGAGVVLFNQFGMFIAMPLLIGGIITALDVAGMRSKHGFASTAFDWRQLDKKPAPPLRSLLSFTLTQIRNRRR